MIAEQSTRLLTTSWCHGTSGAVAGGPVRGGDGTRVVPPERGQGQDDCDGADQAGHAAADRLAQIPDHGQERDHPRCELIARHAETHRLDQLRRLAGVAPLTRGDR
jgi:hypothetical protein